MSNEKGILEDSLDAVQSFDEFATKAMTNPDQWYIAQEEFDSNKNKRLVLLKSDYDEDLSIFILIDRVAAVLIIGRTSKTHGPATRYTEYTMFPRTLAREKYGITFLTNFETGLS